MGKSKLQKEKRAAEQRQDWREVATLCNALGGELQAAGDLQGALQEHRQEREACALLDDTLGIGVAHRRIGEVLCELGETDEALEHQQKHLRLAAAAGSVLEQQRAYATIGRTQLDRAERTANEGERQTAISAASENFLQSLQKCKELPSGSVDPAELALMRCRLYLNLGLVADMRGDANKAIGLITQASTLGRQHAFQEDLYRCHASLGIIYLKQQKLGPALEETKHTVTLAAKLSSYEKIESQRTLGRVYVLCGDILKAKRAFSMAYKVTAAGKGDVSELKGYVKAATKICQLEKVETEALTDKELLIHLEKMGDLYAQLKCPDKAIEYYKKVLEEASVIGRSEEELAPIYYSIAQTYDESHKFREAREYYEKEYEVRLGQDPKEACRTMLAIASVAEQLGESIEELEQYYERAHDLAAKAVYPKLQVHVLKLHAAFESLSQDKKMDLEAKIERIQQENDLGSDFELTDDESGEESSVELSDTDDEFDDSSKSGPSNTVIIRGQHKVNFFGETPLHKACIRGNLKLAKQLLKEGHAVNVRDSAGWLPLHEACNHGHTEVVSLLLSAGAHINDRGGKECGGVTPIHDAATNGKYDIVRLLIRKGASVIIKNNKGQTPLDCWITHKEGESSWSDEDRKQYYLVEKELKAAMETAGYRVASETQHDGHSTGRGSSLRHQRTGSSEHLPPSSSCRPVDSLSDTSDAPIIEDDSSSEDEMRSGAALNSSCSSPPSKRAAIHRYRSAISGLGSAAARGHSPEERPLPAQAVKKAKSGLITEEEFVGEDDFIENDLGIVNSRKRKRPVSNSFMDLTGNSRVSVRKTPGQDGVRTPTVRKLTAQKTRQTKLTTIMDRYSIENRMATGPIDDYSTSADDIPLFDLPSLQNDQFDDVRDGNHTDYDGACIKVAATSTASGKSISSISSTTTTAGTAGPLRLRVKVEDKTLLVPIAEASRECSIEWLAAEVSRRYYQLTGIKPEISLQTSDGAILHPSDPITLVLGAEKEELLATVSGWDLPPLQQRYAQDCLYYKQPSCPLITAALTAAESSAILDLQNIARSQAQLKLVIRAIQRHQNLHTLSLSYTKLTDDGFTLLLEALPSLTGLATINLQASGITKKALCDWTEKIDGGEFSKSSLTNINLSYNTLLGSSLSNLASLLSLPNIISLNLKHCYLDIQHLCPLKTCTSLQVLQLDYNEIHCSPLKQLLSNTPSVKHLSLCGLRCASEGDNGVALALSNLLGGGSECSLEHLDLSYVNLTPFEMDGIRAYLYRCPNLAHLALAHNAELTGEAMVTVLSELESNFSIPVTALHLHGIHIVSDGFAHSLIQLLQRKFNMQKPMQTLSYRSFPYSNLIIDTWRNFFTSKSKVNFIGSEVFLDVIR